MAARDDYDNSYFSCDVLIGELTEWLIDHDIENLPTEVTAADCHRIRELHVRLAAIVEWLLQEAS